MIFEENEEYLLIKEEEKSKSFIKITDLKVYIKTCNNEKIFQYDLKYFYENINAIDFDESDFYMTGKRIQRYFVFYLRNEKLKIHSDINKDNNALIFMEKINQKIKFFLKK